MVMPCDVQNKHEILLGDADPLCTSDKNDGADDNVSRSMRTVNVTGR